MTGFVPGLVGEIEFDGGAGGFGLRGQQRVRLFMRGEQGFDALAKGCVVVAGTIEKCGAFVRRLGERGGKQGFFAVCVHGAAGSKGFEARIDNR